MNAITGLAAAYHWALRLYPRRFREEYGQEMAGTFVQSCRDAGRASPWAVGKLCLRELRDLPASLVKEYWAELWRGAMEYPMGGSEPEKKSVLRGTIAFGAGFTLVYFLYSLLDISLNLGRTFLDANNAFWRFPYLNPTALACGVGAVILGFVTNKRRAWLSALAGFVGYTLVYLALSFLRNPPLTAQPGWYYFLVAPSLYSVAAGLVVGCAIGYSQLGWKKTGRYALAGATGFTAGWVLDRLAAAAILQISPYDGYVVRVVVGSPWYFVYMLVPALIYGLAIGLALGIASASPGPKPQMAVA